MNRCLSSCLLELAAKRRLARAAKNFKDSDILRSAIFDHGGWWDSVEVTDEAESETYVVWAHAAYKFKIRFDTNGRLELVQLNGRKP